MDFSYRIPGARNGLTFYAEGLAEHDEITPILGPDVAAWLAGIDLEATQDSEPRFPPRGDIQILHTAAAMSHTARSTGTGVGSPVFRMPDT